MLSTSSLPMTPANKEPPKAAISTLSGKKNKTQLMRALATNKGNKCTHKLRDIFKSQDVFGEQVHFTFKGKRSYHTSIGAFVSIFVKIILVAFIIYEFYIIFSRKHPLVYTKYAITPNSIDPTLPENNLNPTERGFDIALGFYVRGTSVSN